MEDADCFKSTLRLLPLELVLTSLPILELLWPWLDFVGLLADLDEDETKPEEDFLSVFSGFLADLSLLLVLLDELILDSFRWEEDDSDGFGSLLLDLVLLEDFETRLSRLLLRLRDQLRGGVSDLGGEAAMWLSLLLERDRVLERLRDRRVLLVKT